MVDAYMELLFAGLPEQQTGSAMGLSMYAEEMAQKRGEASCGSRQEAAQSHLLVGGMMESACRDGDDNPSVLIALAKGALVMLQQPPMDVTQEVRWRTYCAHLPLCHFGCIRLFGYSGCCTVQTHASPRMPCRQEREEAQRDNVDPAPFQVFCIRYLRSICS